MPTITFDLPKDVADTLTRRAKSLLLSRRQYLRSLLSEVAREIERQEIEDRTTVCKNCGETVPAET